MLLAFASTDLDVAVVLGFLGGIFLFFKGFRVYREYRVLADTPEEPIRSIPMGLVRVHGKATGEQRVTSPVTRTPCFFYKVDIEKWVKGKDSGHWVHDKTDFTGVPFYLDDATGKVLVDAHGAEYDLIQSGKRETGRGTIGWGKLLSGIGDPALATGSAPTDAELVSYVESVGAGAGVSISEKIKQAALSTVPAVSVGYSSGAGVSISEELKQAALGGGLSLGGGFNISLGGSSYGRYRLTEYCILPDHWYDVTGSCVENPTPKDPYERNMIRKGQNEPTFLISWRASKEIVKTLRYRAAFQVFGGAALSLGCLTVLLKRFGWL